MSVPVLAYIITLCMSVYVSGSYLFLSFSLNICSSDRLSYYSLYVYMSVSWFVFLSVSLWMPILSLMFLSMYGYIVTVWTCKSTSLDPRFSLSVFVLSIRLCPSILSVKFILILIFYFNFLNFASIRLLVLFFLSLFFSLSISVGNSVRLYLSLIHISEPTRPP